MLKKSFLVFIMTLGFISLGYGFLNGNMSGISKKGSISLYGQQNIDNSSFEKLYSYGNTKLDKVTVSKEVSISGKLSADGSNFKKITVNGRVILSDTTVSDKANFVGAVTADKCEFEALFLTTKKAALSDTKVFGSIVIEKANKKNPKQVLILDNVTVKGDITFKGGNGKVIKKGTVIINGNVYGEI